MQVIDRAGLDALQAALKRKGFKVFGPVLRGQAVVYGKVESTSDFPAGWTDEQKPGFYRIKQKEDAGFFGYASSPDSWKRFLHPPESRLWEARGDKEGLGFHPVRENPQPLAFIGVRPCDLQGMAILDRVLGGKGTPDTGYAGRRKKIFTVVVNCGEPGGTCFCGSMGTGPRARSGFDLSLTEMREEVRPEYLVEIGSPAGQKILDGIPGREASEKDREAARRVTDRAASKMGRTLVVSDIKERLYRNTENPRWEAVAERCLACGNCTMVCPTCFCTTFEETLHPGGVQAGPVRRWDSCFTLDFSYVHPKSVRESIASRYRQWLTHKLASWEDQFGTLGCVGCGRCITWCPAGIDLTEEAGALSGDGP